MMVIFLSVKFEFDWTNRFLSQNLETKMWTDRWTSDTSTQQTFQMFINVYKPTREMFR